MIQCPYHAWTYGLDGRLVGAPHMDAVPDFEKADYSLHEVNLAIWEGFVFVNLAEAPTPLEKVFATLEGKFTHWNLPRLRSARRIEYDVAANWKLIFQNYSECYHCPGVHPALSKISPYDSAENDLCEGPFLGGFMEIAKGTSLTMSGRPARARWARSWERIIIVFSITPSSLTCCSACTRITSWCTRSGRNRPGGP